MSVDALDGHLSSFLGDDAAIYRKFFLAHDSVEFCQRDWGFGHVRFDHGRNIHNLAPIITKCFVHVVSETMSSTYHPFVTEKFLYSVVTRGLFVAYAQPQWHQHLEKIYGFRPYTRLFDYAFDQEINPVKRLVKLADMLSRFQSLTVLDWHDLYLCEHDTVEYNYDHFASGAYLKQAASWHD